MTLGRSSTESKGLSGAGGSVVRTSNPAPEMRPRSKASTRADSSTNPPRAVLTRIGFFFIASNSGVEIMLRVEGNNGACNVITSLVSMTSSNGVYSGAESLNALVGGKDCIHSQRATNAGDRLSDCALADNAKSRSGQVANFVREKAELAALLPFASHHV